MPIWAQIVIGSIVGTAAIVTALRVLWTKLFKPLANLITISDKLLPLLAVFADVFEENPNAFKVLNDIAAQFKTDSGSTLRDVINRLEEAAKENRQAAAELKIGVEAQRLLDIQDRETIQRLILKLDRVSVHVTETAASGVRIEADRAHVADDLARHLQSESRTGPLAPVAPAAPTVAEKIGEGVERIEQAASDIKVELEP